MTKRVTDEVLHSVCGIIEKTEGIGKSEEVFGEVLRKCALDLRDERAEVEWLRNVIEAFEDLASAYRLGCRPKEKTFDVLNAFHNIQAAKAAAMQTQEAPPDA